MLMTATMYNAYYSDIAGQLGLKLEFDEPLGVRPEVLLGSIGEIELAKKTNGQLDTLRAFSHSDSNEDWQKLLGLFLIRRTRKFVEENFGEFRKSENRYVMKYPDGSEYSFPKRKPLPLSYQGGPNDPGDRLASPENFEAMAELTYARYRLGKYLKSGAVDLGEGDESLVADLKKSVNSYSGFIRTTALKRLTSSAHAFLITLNRMLLRSYVLSYALEHKKPLPVGTLSNAAYELDEEEAADVDVADFEDAAFQENPENIIGVYGRAEAEWRDIAAKTYEHLAEKKPPGLRWADISWFDVPALKADVNSDAQVMSKIVAQHGNWDPAADSKLSALAQFITSTESGKKVLVFSEYKDTIQYVGKHLPQLVTGRVIETIDGSTAKPEEIAQRFAPESNGGLEPHLGSEIDVLLATDVLSEGQNLQDADTVINWDLPWTIIPIIQRAGRVDRVGQKASEISVLSFMPQDGLEDLLELRKRLMARLKNSAEMFGAGDKFFPDDGIVTDDLISSLFDGTANLNLDEGDVDYPSFALGIWNAASDEARKKVLSMQDSRYSTMPAGSAHDPGTLAYSVTSSGYHVVATHVDSVSSTMAPINALRATKCSPDEEPLPRREEFYWELESLMKHVFHEGEEQHFLAVNKGLRKRLFEALMTVRDTLESADSLRTGIGHLIDALVVSPIAEGAASQVLSILKSTGNLAEGPQGLDQLMDLHREGKLFKQLKADQGEARLVCAMGFSG